MTRAPRLIEHAAGLTWIAPEPQLMQRASHALVAEGRVWVIDPVDFSGVDDTLRSAGSPAAVVQLLDRHSRDCVALARRLGVPHIRLPSALAGSPFEAVSAVSFPGWREVALWWPAVRALVVAEAVGTVPYYRARAEPVAVHPLLRLTPPRRLRGFDPEHLLVGHGEGMHGPGTAEALSDALRTARRRTSSYLVRLVTTRGRAAR